MTITTPLELPVAPPRRTPLSVWRSMPLAAHLGIIGAMVTIAWVWTAHVAAEQQHQRETARMEELRRLHRAELITERLGTAMETMVAAHRGFVLSGRQEVLEPFTNGDRRFAISVASLRDMAGLVVIRDPRLLSLSSHVERWKTEIVQPNIELRRRDALSAFTAGGVGAERIGRGIAMMDSARIALEGVRADLRAQNRILQTEMEEASAYDEMEIFRIIAAAGLIFLLLGVLILHIVSRSLDQVITAAEALESGRYAQAQLPEAERAPNREFARLAATFDQVSVSIQARERQLQDDIVRLKELERLKTDFVSTVSHELRTPLTSMRGALGLILGGKTGDLPGRGRELLQIAMSNTERLIRLINDILDIDKIDAGQSTVRHDRLLITPLLDMTVAGLEALARDANVTLRVTSDDKAAEVIGDADRLIQVFTNLVSNAIKFSPAGATVDLSAHSGDDAITVDVRDRGPGIPPEFTDRIFGRFQQAGGAASRKSGGTGLGLNIARGIVELHGGRIGFEPAPDGGTVFRVVFPRAPGISSEFGARQAVLVIEDDQSMREVLVAQIENFARPIAVSSAEEALEVLAAEPIEVLILDPGLPGMDGFEFARLVRAHPQYERTHIFVYSAEEHDPEKLVHAGIRATDAYVKSRDSDAVMFDRLRAVLRTRH